MRNTSLHLNDITAAQWDYEHTRWIQTSKHGRVPFNDVLKALSQVRQRPNCRIFSRLMTSQSQVLSDYLSSVEIKVEAFVRDFPDFNYPDTLL